MLLAGSSMSPSVPVKSDIVGVEVPGSTMPGYFPRARSAAGSELWKPNNNRVRQQSWKDQRFTPYHEVILCGVAPIEHRSCTALGGQQAANGSPRWGACCGLRRHQEEREPGLAVTWPAGHRTYLRYLLCNTENLGTVSEGGPQGGSCRRKLTWSKRAPPI